MIFFILYSVFVTLILMFVMYTLFISIKRNIQITSFFESTLDDTEEIMKFVDNLSKRELLSSDSDVQKFVKTVGIFYDIVTSYSVAGQKMFETKNNIKNERENK